MNYAFAGDSFHFGKTHTKRRANWRWHSGAEPIPACWEEEGGPLAMEARNSARLARDAEGQISTVKLPSSFPRATREHTMNSRSPWSLPPLSVTLKIRRGGAATSPVAKDPHAPAAGRVARIFVPSSPNQEEFTPGGVSDTRRLASSQRVRCGTCFPHLGGCTAAHPKDSPRCMVWGQGG